MPKRIQRPKRNDPLPEDAIPIAPCSPPLPPVLPEESLKPTPLDVSPKAYPEVFMGTIELPTKNMQSFSLHIRSRLHQNCRQITAVDSRMERQNAAKRYLMQGNTKITGITRRIQNPPAKWENVLCHLTPSKTSRNRQRTPSNMTRSRAPPFVV